MTQKYTIKPNLSNEFSGHRNQNHISEESEWSKEEKSLNILDL